MMHQIKKYLYSFVFIAVFIVCSLSTMHASHNVSRYFPFLEPTTYYVLGKRSHIAAEYFYTTASTAFRTGSGHGGIPELWGLYDLKDVINSLQVVRASQGIAVDPVKQVTGTDQFLGKSAMFGVSGKVRSQGLYLDYEQVLKWHGFSVGASLPIMHINTASRFAFKPQESNVIFQGFGITPDAQAQLLLVVDQIRRQTHQDIGFQGNEWSKTGFGDLDMHVRWTYFADHVALMRSIDFNMLFGVLAPTGVLSDINYPAALSFMDDGHWAFYFDIMAEFELKQDWKAGLIFGFIEQLKHTRTLRIPVTVEPAIFSALIGRVQVDPGFTFKVSPYVTLENLTDGLHFQVRYTYLRHNQDTWKDKRTPGEISMVQSYLQKDPAIIACKKKLSKWTSQYITFQLTYDAKEAMKKWFMDPYLYARFDMPFGGNGIAKTNQLSLGVELHF